MAEASFTLPVFCSPDTVQDPSLPPALIRVFLAELGASTTLTRRVWNRLRVRVSYDDLHVITQAHRLPEVKGLAAVKRVLTPAVLCRITEALAPATGQPRPPDVLELERSILEQTTATGTWREPA